MAQSGYTPIQHYRTTVAGAAPSASNLTAGELGFNINDADMALYAKNNSGIVKRIMNNPAGLKYPTTDGSAANQVLKTDGAGNLTFLALTASRALVSSASGGLGVSAVTSTELGYVSGVTSAIQTQLNAKVDKVTSTDNAIPRFDGTAGAVQNSSVYIDDSGSLGVGTSTPAAKLHVRMESTTAESADVLFLSTISGGGFSVNCSDLSASNPVWILHSFASEAIAFTQGTTERMRIDASTGNLLVGYTTSNGSYKLQVNSQIFATSSTIATSDGRYKQDVQELRGTALDAVMALRPVQFRWKEHPVHAFDLEHPTTGFIAQEVQAALADKPYLASVVKRNECTIEPAEYETIELEPAIDAVLDEEGNVVTDAVPAVTEQRLTKEAVTEEFLGIAEGNLIAVLTAAMQEQQAMIETLKARIDMLEGAA